jgi:N-carbamoyl-L-amino-acid hydrolase
MDLISVSRENIAKHIEEFSRVGRLGEFASDGFLRASWSDEESKLFEYVEGCAREIGMLICYDEIGNLFMRTNKGFGQVVQVGSHLDSVPEGGNYDGVAGIIAGLEVVRAIVESGFELKKDLEIVIWRGEESATYDTVYKGSRAAFGVAPVKMLEKEFGGQILGDAIRTQGFSVNCVIEGYPTLDQKDIDGISAHIELHIEQGKKLERDGVDIGNIMSIRGPCRYLIKVSGEFDHSGATPMGVKYRRDANLAIAHMQVALDELSRSENFFGKDLVQTVGEVNSNLDFDERFADLKNSSITKVCGFGYFTLEVRSDDNSFMDEYIVHVHRCIRDIANRFNVDVEIEKIDSSSALQSLCSNIQSKVSKACDVHGYSSISMPSGAGHDATVVAKQIRSDGSNVPVGMIFIPCKGGRSHCKEEYASVEAIGKGADVLAHTMYSLAS